MIQEEAHNIVMDATPEQQERAKALIGSPFVQLPGNPPQDKVLAIIDGYEIQVDLVEMVWNDKSLIDAVYGEGVYRKLQQEKNPTQLKVLDLAESLYNA